MCKPSKSKIDKKKSDSNLKDDKSHKTIHKSVEKILSIDPEAKKDLDDIFWIE